MVGIYKILSPSGKVYIGQSWDIQCRWKSHYSNGSGYPLNNSFTKYGKDKHIFKVIHELPIDVTQNILNDYEVLYMDLYKLTGHILLNIKGGGSNGKLAESTKAKIGKSNSVSLLGKESPRKGISMSDSFGEDRAIEIKNKISQKLIGKPLTQKAIEKRKQTYKENGHHAKGKKASLELRQKLSNAHIGVQAGENHPHAKLTNEAVKHIFTSNNSVKCLARKYKVTIQSIHYIRKSMTWTHVTNGLERYKTTTKPTLFYK